jgi:hypothetical protein
MDRHSNFGPRGIRVLLAGTAMACAVLGGCGGSVQEGGLAHGPAVVDEVRVVRQWERLRREDVPREAAPAASAASALPQAAAASRGEPAAVRGAASAEDPSASAPEPPPDVDTSHADAAGTAAAPPDDRLTVEQ